MLQWNWCKGSSNIYGT